MRKLEDIDPQIYSRLLATLREYPPGDKRRIPTIATLRGMDVGAAGISVSAKLLAHMASDDNTYRVAITATGVLVVCFGLESVDSQLEGHYDCVDDLPNWVKERIALLNMIPVTPPIPEVVGVGRRISASVYWVQAPDTTTEASASA